MAIHIRFLFIFKLARNKDARGADIINLCVFAVKQSIPFTDFIPSEGNIIKPTTTRYEGQKIFYYREKNNSKQFFC